MSPNVEQLIEYATQDVVKILVKERGCTVPEAIDLLYPSKTYAALIDPDTGLYLQSPSYIYEVYRSLDG